MFTAFAHLERELPSSEITQLLIRIHSPLLGCYAFCQSNFFHLRDLLRLFLLAVPRFLTFYAIPALAVVQYLLASFIQTIHIMATVIYNVYFDPLQVWLCNYEDQHYQ
jgi:hypothetical protein